jgi:hypothetical protein
MNGTQKGIAGAGLAALGLLAVLWQPPSSPEVEDARERARPVASAERRAPQALEPSPGVAEESPEESQVDLAEQDLEGLTRLLREALASGDLDLVEALLTTLRTRLPELSAVYGREGLLERLLPLIDAALGHEEHVELAVLGFALLADLDPERFRERMLAAAARPEAERGLIGGVLSALNRLSPADGRDALSGIGVGQFARVRALPADDHSLDTQQRRLFADGAIRELVKRMPQAELGARLVGLGAGVGHG